MQVMRSVGWVRELRGGRLLGLPIVALGLLAVTALASREPLSAFGKQQKPLGGGFRIDASPWEFALIAAGGLIAFVWVLIYGGWSRRTPAAGRLPHLLLRLLAPLVAALLIAGGLQGLHPRGPLRSYSKAAVTSAHAPSTHTSWFTVPGWVTWGIVGTLVTGVILVIVGASVRPRRGEESMRQSAMESALTAALADLESIDDPRLAIIAAYSRMEQSLADAGFPRATPEAPREYLGRVASALEIDPTPLGTLTSLFEAAKFSLRQLDATARRRAIAALHALQAQLA